LRAELVDHKNRLAALEAGLGNTVLKHVPQAAREGTSAEVNAKLRRKSKQSNQSRDLETGMLPVLLHSPEPEQGAKRTPPGAASPSTEQRKQGNATPVVGAGVGALTEDACERRTTKIHLMQDPTPRQLVPSTYEGLDGSAAAARMFDQDFLKAIYDKPLTKRRQKGAMVGGGVVGLMTLPFGPIGMVAGFTFGAMIGAVIGFCMDRNKGQHEIKEAEAQKRKLTSLVRWALNNFHEEATFVKVIEMVTLEFKPIADIADNSKHARKTLKLLDAWIAQKKVTRNLWIYMDSLLQRWHDLERADFLRSLLVFQPLTTMYRHSKRALDEQEVQFLHRMETLLGHESVKLIMTHAQLYPTEGETRLMECMVYADAIHRGNKKRRNTGKDRGNHGGLSPCELPSPKHSDHDESSESDEESLLSYYTSKGTLIGPSNDGADPFADHLEPSGIAAKPCVLKQPFFKNYEDFMDFDIGFKHKMPITLSEFALLQQKADEPLKGWDVCVDRKEIKVAKTQNDTGCITLRAWATVPGVDMNVAFFLFTNHTERVKWDKVFAIMEVVEPNMQGSSILYSLLRVPVVTDRDFLQYRRIRVMDDGSIHIVLRSAEHLDMPEQKGAIRAESYNAGYILRQTFEGDTPVLNIFIMSCLDIKGFVPKWLINATAPRKPAEWVEALKKASVDYMKANPNFKETLADALEEYKQHNPYDYEEDLPEALPENAEVSDSCDI